MSTKLLILPSLRHHHTCTQQSKVKFSNQVLHRKASLHFCARNSSEITGKFSILSNFYFRKCKEDDACLLKNRGIRAISASFMENSNTLIVFAPWYQYFVWLCYLLATEVGKLEDVYTCSWKLIIFTQGFNSVIWVGDWWAIFVYDFIFWNPYICCSWLIIICAPWYLLCYYLVLCSVHGG